MNEPPQPGDVRETGGLESQAGVIIETPVGRRFVPAQNALTALDNPRLSPLPGTLLDLLWFEGRVVPAASWSILTADTDAADLSRTRRESSARKPTAERSALVCEHGGQLLALTGVELVASGRFSRAGSDADGAVSVVHGSAEIPSADLSGLFAAAVALTRGPDESRDEPTNTGDSGSEPPAPEDPT